MKMADVRCSHCGSVYQRNHKEANRSLRLGKPQYCSAGCIASARGFGATVDITCETCGVKVSRQASSLKKSKSGNHYCSKRCSARGSGSAFRSGEGHPNWKGMDYRKFRGDRCDCGVAEPYLLFVHHIDGDRENNDPSNLETVCANCHIRRHLAVKNGTLIYNSRSLTIDGPLVQ